jgi:hypothetical protein
MIGFTFLMALTRYEARVAEVVEAANAIGKAALPASSHATVQPTDRNFLQPADRL